MRKRLYSKEYGLNQAGVDLTNLTTKMIKRFLNKVDLRKFDHHDFERVVLRAIEVQITLARLKDLCK